MIYTGYYAKFNGNNGLSISLHPPKWTKFLQYKPLAPTQQILDWWNNSPKGLKEQKIYKRLYQRDVLNHLDVHTIAKELDGKVLLCYERPDEFCHRQLVAEWFRTYGYPCKEIDPIPEQELYEMYGQLYEMFGKNLKIIE